MLLEYFDNYLTFDGTICMDDLPQRERELIFNGQNPRYWEKLRINPEKYKKQRKRFKDYIQTA